jgi:protein involved in polysaccharide export with SLBB domain
VFQVSKILNRLKIALAAGAVFRPDTYSFYGMRISDLISKADGLKKMHTVRARIIRLKSDLTTEIVMVNLEQALRGDEALMWL